MFPNNIANFVTNFPSRHKTMHIFALQPISTDPIMTRRVCSEIWYLLQSEAAGLSREQSSLPAATKPHRSHSVKMNLNKRQEGSLSQITDHASPHHPPAAVKCVSRTVLQPRKEAQRIDLHRCLIATRNLKRQKLFGMVDIRKPEAAGWGHQSGQNGERLKLLYHR